MALNPIALERLVPRLKPGQAVASMGYPDILYPPELLATMLGERIAGLKYRPESREICGRHSIKYQGVPDAESFFDIYGVTLDVFDIVAERGGEIVIDLNKPLPENAVGQFDYVLDVGTLEHCFNVAQALINMASLLKVGGLIFHENPFNWGNHGFWNLNPTLYHDYYTENGFRLVECAIVRGPMARPVPATDRFSVTGFEANCFVIAEKLEALPATFPVQTKYKEKAWAKS